MSKLNTVPVYKCRHCGEFVTFSVETTESDPTGEKLNKIAANLHKIAVCKKCRRRSEYHQSNPGSVPFIVGPTGEPVKIIKVGKS